MTIDTGHNGARPVPVEITNTEALAGMAGRARPRGYVRSVYRTFVLTAANPVIPVLAEDLSRSGTWFQAYGNSVVLCESQSQAQDPDNVIAGTGQFAGSPANPQGTLLFVPSATGGVSSSLFSTGTQTSPGAGTNIAGPLALVAGVTYTVEWVVSVGGAQSASDLDNFILNFGPSSIVSLNPGVAPATPAVPASTVAQQNNNPFPVTVVVTGGAATVTTVNGITVGTGDGTFIVPAAGTIAVTYSSAPTWAWSNASPPAQYPQQPVQIVTPAGGYTLTVKANGAASTGAVYAAQIIATPVSSLATPVSSDDSWLVSETTEPMWATALAFPAVLAMVTHNKVEGY